MIGWLQLMDEVKVATTFEQIREAGERFGKIIGREAARALAMLLMAAIGSTAKLFAAKVPTLPGSAQVSVQAEGTARISLPAWGAVEEIALTAEGVSVTVAATAMTMGASGTGGTGPCIDTHHTPAAHPIFCPSFRAVRSLAPRRRSRARNILGWRVPEVRATVIRPSRLRLHGCLVHEEFP